MEEVICLYKEGQFAPKNHEDLDKTMLSDEGHPNYVGKPEHFTDKKCYTDAMRFIAMGMDNKYLQLLATGNLEDKRLREIAATITTNTLHKVAHLEYTY